MNEIDDKVFDEYLGRASGVSRHYGELPADQVPPALDERVLHEARAAVAKKAALKSKSRNLARWSVPLALAASVVLVVTVVRDTDMQKRAAPSAEFEVRGAAPERYEADSDAATVQPAAPSPAVSDSPPAATSPRAQFVPEPKGETETVLVTGGLIRGTPEDAALPVEVITTEPVVEEPKLAGVAPPAPASIVTAESQLQAMQKQALEDRRDARDLERVEVSGNQVSASAARDNQDAVAEVMVTGERRRATPPVVAGPRSTITPALSSIPQRPVAAPAWETDPQAWLEHIRELRKKNDHALADREWARFEDAYPEFEVAESDEARPRKR